MKTSTSIFVSCFLIAAFLGTTAEAADLTGRFIYEGATPTPAKVRVDKDAEAFGEVRVHETAPHPGLDRLQHSSVDEGLHHGPRQPVLRRLRARRQVHDQRSPDRHGTRVPSLARKVRLSGGSTGMVVRRRRR